MELSELEVSCRLNVREVTPLTIMTMFKRKLCKSVVGPAENTESIKKSE